MIVSLQNYKKMYHYVQRGNMSKKFPPEINYFQFLALSSQTLIRLISTSNLHHKNIRKELSNFNFLEKFSVS